MEFSPIFRLTDLSFSGGIGINIFQTPKAFLNRPRNTCREGGGGKPRKISIFNGSDVKEGRGRALMTLPLKEKKKCGFPKRRRKNEKWEQLPARRIRFFSDWLFMANYQFCFGINLLKVLEFFKIPVDASLVGSSREKLSV